MFDGKFVCFSNLPGPLSLVGGRIVVDQTDFPGIHIAARNLAEDFARVTKGAPSPLHILTDEKNCFSNEVDAAIIVGIIEKMDNPYKGCRRALVIAGSDKRGAIFGVYALSEQIGVSPWYWWADVVPEPREEIYALPVITTQGEPSIRFRGIFIDDEAPSLTGWAQEKFGGYDVDFYKKVFELLLRLKANFLWPAMWPGYPNPGASFFLDDLENQKTAEEYGICISTSHHEPMQRLSNEWFAENPDGSWNWLTNKQKITKFFDEGVRRAKGCESYFTMGMRGEYDRKMPTDDPAAVVRDVIKTQRAIIKDIHGREDTVPQLLDLYKEVQEQYESSRLEVPNDVTLLFSDDNFGTIRRLPRGDEAKRMGGAGIYYHFEYVGVPRSYKWTNSISLPLEIPMTFFMRLACDISSIKADGFAHFFSTMAKREFGPELSHKVGAEWHEYDRLASMRRHEHIEPHTFSLLHYNEAEYILGRWKALLADAEGINERTPKSQHASVFELVVHPIKASYIFVALQTSLGSNQTYARQHRNSANMLAQRVLDLFNADFSLSEEFHALLNGRWNHIMQQPHHGFGDSWHAPSRDMISGLCHVHQRRQNSNPIAGRMGIAVEGHGAGETYDILLDGNQVMQAHRLLSEPVRVGELPDGWASAVQDCIWVRKHKLAGD
ncbi:uncharacterized protein PAC_00927 [Phialocephala subalpina]|uniref:Gylcosyl hydrolase 115 C-terminal domain-containing protein n=1 Tax=Phialocephala subalpina TaxID=576137 RepID=A0A1L7WE34_9HELO|nr:uncharacterized protein PAC_00927 [Phialocephala subalpina]